LAAPVRILFICQAVDRADPVLATTPAWIRALAEHPAVERVIVLALRTGSFELPGNVEVHRFGTGRRTKTLLRFYRQVLMALRRGIDFFFIYQGGPYPLLLLPLKAAFRKPIYQWKGHPAITRATAFHARWCDDLIFTNARAGSPMDLPSKIRVVGQGVDTTLFRPADRPKRSDVLVIGRIAPVKRIDQVIRALALANVTYATSYGAEVVGPVLPGREHYAAKLSSLVSDLGMEGLVRLRGPVEQSALPEILWQSRVCVNLSKTAVDRSAVEAMACGIPVLTSNDSVAEILPDDLTPLLVVDKFDTAAQAGALHRLLSMSPSELTALGARLRDLIVREHSVDDLFDRVLGHIARHRDGFTTGRAR
jgi:glycosyltransferase involved in cell wall biosynthesis